MQSSIFIELHRSRFLDFLLVLAHVVAATCVVLAPLPVELQLLAGCLLTVSAERTLRRPQFDHVRLTEVGVVLSSALSGHPSIEAVILPETSVSRYLIVLSLCPKPDESSKQRIRLVLLPDQMQSSDFRQLRVWLRWKIRTGATNGAV